MRWRIASFSSFSPAVRADEVDKTEEEEDDKVSIGASHSRFPHAPPNLVSFLFLVVVVVVVDRAYRQYRRSPMME